MFNDKCGRCNRKVKKSFDFCPSCGYRLDGSKEDYGMLGRNDAGNFQEDLKLPFGMGKMVNSLVKQLEKQMNEGNMNGKPGPGGMPRGFQVKISTGKPGQVGQMGMPRQNGNGGKEVVEQKRVVISQEEMDRREKLKRVDAKSNVRRLSDRIIYEIEAPGVKSNKDVVISKLATGLEIKAYSDKKCYVKFIPLTVEVIRYKVSKEKVFVELKA